MTTTATREAIVAMRDVRRRLYETLTAQWLTFMGDGSNIDLMREPWALAVARVIQWLQIEAGYVATDARTMSYWQAGYKGTPPKPRVTPGRVHNYQRAYLTAQVAGPITFKQRIGSGYDPDDALRSALSSVLTTADVQVTDAYDTTLFLDLLTDTNVIGWRRVLIDPSCDRCEALAGRIYRSSTVEFTLPGEDRDQAVPLPALSDAQIAGLIGQAPNTVETWGFRRHPRCDCQAEPVWMPPGMTPRDYNRRGSSILTNDETWAQTPDFQRYKALRREARYWNVVLPFDLAAARENPSLLDDWRTTMRWYMSSGRPDAAALAPVLPRQAAA